MEIQHYRPLLRELVRSVKSYKRSVMLNLIPYNVARPFIQCFTLKFGSFTRWGSDTTAQSHESWSALLDLGSSR